MLSAMPIYRIREKFVMLLRLDAESREDALAKWLAMRAYEESGALTIPGRSFLSLLDEGRQRNPEVEEVPAHELQAERDALDRDGPAPED